MAIDVVIYVPCYQPLKCAGAPCAKSTWNTEDSMLLQILLSGRACLCARRLLDRLRFASFRDQYRSRVSVRSSSV
jgi:hypothetical protein